MQTTRNCLPNNERTMASANDDAGRNTRTHKNENTQHKGICDQYGYVEAKNKGKSTHRFGARNINGRTEAKRCMHAFTTHGEHMQV